MPNKVNFMRLPCSLCVLHLSLIWISTWVPSSHMESLHIDSMTWDETASASGITPGEIHSRCSNNSHVVGQWVYNTDTTVKSFYCCGWYNSDYAWDLDVCGNSSYVSNDRHKYFSGSTEYMAQFGASACICDQQRTHVSRRESYHWSPASCRLPEWDAVEFCRLLGRRKILFIGDSTMMQAASTVMSMTTAAGGHCADQLAYYRNDFLWHRHRDASEAIGTGLSFKEAVLRLHPDICVLTTGAHYKSMEEMVLVWHQVHAHIEAIRAKIPDVKMVWKTQSPGHVNCFGSDRPTTFHGSEEWSEEDKYNWYLFPAFDKLSIEQSQLLNIRILDMSPLYSRIDAHAMRDCLHFCVPGPLDLFSVLLLNMLISADI